MTELNYRLDQMKLSVLRLFLIYENLIWSNLIADALI